MKKLTRTGIAALSTGLLITMVGVGTASAHERGSGGGSVEGDGSSFGSFKFHGHNGSRDPFDASGYFKGTSPAGPIITLQGPITCLVVDGNRAGFIYRIDNSSTPSPFTGQEVKVSIEQGRAGGKDKIGFSFGAPAGTNKDCKPGDASSNVDKGYVKVRGNGGHD